MFRGKYLPSFFERFAPAYKRIIEQHGIEKVYKVYDYFFAFMSRMQWGQWMVVDKVCPDVSMRQLFYWVVECIYESDLISQFRFAWKEDTPNASLVIECVAPTAEQMKRWQYVLPSVTAPDGKVQFLRRYSLIDWFSRLRQDPKCMPEVNPAWLLLDSGQSDDEAEDDDLSLSSEELPD